MCLGNLLGNRGQRPIAPAVVFEPVLAHEDGMGVTTPLPHQRCAGLQHAGIKTTGASLELCRQNPKAALLCAARTPMGAVLQLIGEPPDDQIATEAHRRSSVMQCPPGTPQLLGRPIDQSGNLAKFKLGQVPVSQSVVPAVVWTENGRRLARVLASRSIMDWRFHRLAGTAMR